MLRPVRDNINREATKFPKEERAERGIICFLFHNPDRLEAVSGRLAGGFVTDFNKRVYDFLTGMIKNGINPDISLFNEEFEPMEMGRITQIVDGTMFVNDLDTLWDYVGVLNSRAEDGQKSTDEMTDEELRAWVHKQKEKKQ